MTGASAIRGSLKEITTVTYLTLDTLFWSKKTIFMSAVSAIVLGMALLGRLISSFNWIRVPFTAAQVFSTLMSTAVIHFLVVFVTLFYGTALISEELEGKTLTYLFVRPVAKPKIMLGKYLALLWISALLVVPTVVLSFLVLYLRSDMREFMGDIGTLGVDLGVVFLALAAYGAFFAVIGAWLKHPILAGLIYAFGWEGIVSYLPGFARKLTVTHYIQSIFPHDDTAGAIAMMIGQRTEPAEAVATLILLSCLMVAAACLIVKEKEYVLEQ